MHRGRPRTAQRLTTTTLGGPVLNLRYHWNREALPIWLVLVHAAVAVIGLAVLALSACNLSGK